MNLREVMSTFLWLRPLTSLSSPASSAALGNTAN
jgi:hypothetical protein